MLGVNIEILLNIISCYRLNFNSLLLMLYLYFLSFRCFLSAWQIIRI